MLPSLAPRNLFRAALETEILSASALESAAQCDRGRAQWAAHKNRLHVFRLFQYVDLLVGAQTAADPSALVAATDVLHPFDRVWSTEGAGYYWGGRAVETCASLSRFALPQQSLIPLHAGVGLALATRALEQHSRHLDAAIETLLADCAAVSADGYQEVAFEALGLAVRTLWPHQAAAIDNALVARAPELSALFWHGLGRGSYFASSTWLPGGIVRWIDRAHQAARHPATAARNAMAGFAWAAVLVNLRSPHVIDALLEQLTAISDDPSIDEGMTSALIVWQIVAPDDDSIARLLAFDAGHGGDIDRRRRWRHFVDGPLRSALEAFHWFATGQPVCELFVCSEP